MSPVQEASEVDEWIDKHQAAKETGLSPSRCLGLGDERKVRTKQGRNRRGQPITMLHRGDLERYVAERENLTSSPDVKVTSKVEPLALPAAEEPKPAPSKFLTMHGAWKRLGGMVPKRVLVDLALAGGISAVDIALAGREPELLFHEDVIDAFRGVNLYELYGKKD